MRIANAMLCPVIGTCRIGVADRPQGLNEGLLINIDVLQCMVSWLIDVRKILQELWIIMAVDKFNDFLRFNLLNKLNSTKSGLYRMAKDCCGSNLFGYYTCRDRK